LLLAIANRQGDYGANRIGVRIYAGKPQPDFGAAA
jgi:hypothetical protein